MDAQQAGLCKTSYKTCEGDIDFIATFPNTQLQSQSQFLLDMAYIVDLTSYALSIPWSNKITNIQTEPKDKKYLKVERDQTISCIVIIPTKQT